MTASAPRTRWNQVKTARKGKVPLSPHIRTVRLWCAYDYRIRKIIVFARYRYIAEKEVRRLSDTILLKLEGTYARPPKDRR